jgi:hypothetical protein
LYDAMTVRGTVQDAQSAAVGCVENRALNDRLSQ